MFAGVDVIDLGHELARDIPVSPNHPPFRLALQRRHGDMIRPDGGSSANEIIVTGGHVGTHVDALGHVSHDGLLYGGTPASDAQSEHGMLAHGIDAFPPMAGRGVLLDVAALHGVETLEPGYEVSADDLDRAEQAARVRVGAGDAAIIRTGWSSHWPSPHFVGTAAGVPGPGPAAAEWLISRGVRIAGAETIAFEVIRPGDGHRTLPVHRMLLVEAGINIIEVMDLRALRAARAVEFGFVLAPLKLRGATGSPVRPLALVDTGGGGQCTAGVPRGNGEV